MTDIVTIRLKRAKSELRLKAKPNLNAWVNNLIEQALGPKGADWAAHYQRRKSTKPARYCSSELRDAER